MPAPSESQLIIDEFLRAASPQYRKNALVALATLGGEQDIRSVVAVAFDDENDGVRARAENEMAALIGPPREHMLRELDKALDDKGRRKAAYEIYARLIDACGGAPPPTRSFWARLKIARKATSPDNFFRGLFRQYPHFGFGTVGGALGLVFMSFLVFVAVGRTAVSDLKSIVAGTILTALGFSIVAAWRARPFASYHDTRVGSALELLRVAEGASLGGIVFAYFILSDMTESLLTAVVTILLFALCLVAVRGGTLLVSGMSRRRAERYLATTAMGGLCGIAVLTLALATGPLLSEQLREPLSENWTQLAAALFGPALAFAHVDAQADWKRRRLRTHPVVGTIAALLIAVPLLGAALRLRAATRRDMSVSVIDAPPARGTNIVALLAGSGSNIREVPVRLRMTVVPAYVPFRLTSTGSVRISVPEDGSLDLAVKLVDSTGQIRQYWDDSREATPLLERGNYALLIERFSRDGAGSATPDSIEISLRNTSTEQELHLRTEGLLPAILGALHLGSPDALTPAYLLMAPSAPARWQRIVSVTSASRPGAMATPRS